MADAKQTATGNGNGNPAQAPVEGKRKRAPQGPRVAKPTAVVALVKGPDGQVIKDATVEVVLSTKDFNEAFKKYKQTPGSDVLSI